MKFPRNISGKKIAKQLKKFGYIETRQSGSHIRLTTKECGEHHITIPNHDPVKLGTFQAIITDIANHFNMDKNELIEKLFK